MRKKFSFLVGLSLFLCAGALAAQSARSPIPMPPDKETKNYGIVVLSTPPATVTNDDPLYERYTSRKIRVSESAIKEWFFIDIRFPVIQPKESDSWSEWLDDIEVKVEVAISGKNKKGKAQIIVLHGAQKLNPVHADDKEHHVRFFIPPYALYRYMIGKDGKRDLKKLAEDLPVMATITWKNTPVSIIFKLPKGSTKNGIYNMFQELGDRRNSYYEYVILPAEYTPWAIRDLDRFETMKIEQQRSR